ncbi:trypsin-like serine protease [Streptomyces sp. AA4]|uniref:S1 family peptidase n=1 Tax=Streptomyces sp. AA4 TaxID=591158 RepID=UPI0025705D21|nr:serine protease [Streptomyces sp. AA4]
MKSAGRRVVAVTLACAALFSTGTAEAIVKGGDSTQRYPFMTSIPERVNQTGDRGVCGGSLIDPQWVVTAGHCVDSALVTPDGTVRIGSEHRNSGGTVRRIAQVVTHPGYALQSESVPFNRNDVALLKLDRPVAEKPIRLASRPGEPGTPTRLLGFGTTVDTYDFTKARFPERLQELDVRRGAESECGPGYAGRTRLCTVSPRREAMACIGDSGGPQIRRGPGWQWELIGVTSGPGAARAACAGGPGLYSSVPAYADWIRATIRSNRGGN